MSAPKFDPDEIVINLRSACLYLISRMEHFDPVNDPMDRAQYVLLPGYLRHAIDEIELLRALLKA